MKLCIKRLIAFSVVKGSRNNAGIIIASECRRIGTQKVETRGILKTWNLRNKPPLTIDELNTILDSAYLNNYEYGCREDGILRTIVRCPGVDKCDYYKEYIKTQLTSADSVK